MPLSFKQKQKIVKELRKNLASAKSVIFFNFNKLKVEDFSKLRKEIKKVKGKVQVVKKNLLSLALKEKDIGLEKFPSGQLGIVFDFENGIDAIKPIYKFSLEEKNLQIQQGFWDKEHLTRQKIIELAKLPSKHTLLMHLLYSLQFPITGFTFALKDNLRKLTSALFQISQKQK